MKRFLVSIFIAVLCPLPGFASVDWVWVDKSERKMYLVDGDVVVREYTVSLGANPQGHKRERGDEKTPEGTYTLDFVKEDSSFYRAMHISYPNAYDRHDALSRGVSPGGSIMVHGIKNGYEQLSDISHYFDWTDGCIAIKNHEMDEFLRMVKVGTPIRIEW